MPSTPKNTCNMHRHTEQCDLDKKNTHTQTTKKPHTVSHTISYFLAPHSSMIIIYYLSAPGNTRYGVDLLRASDLHAWNRYAGNELVRAAWNFGIIFYLPFFFNFYLFIVKLFFS